jgi:uncharacterized protein (DUF1501 family)
MPVRRDFAGCVPADHPDLGRRRLVQAGGLALFGATLGDVLQWQAQAGQTRVEPRAKSVVFIYQGGGPSQHETFDPKPDAPAEYRGDYDPIATASPELRICEHLPRLAQRADKFTIVRTLHHPADRAFRNEHNASQYLLCTGTTELPPGENTGTIGLVKPRRFEWPSLGAAIGYALGPRTASCLPAAVDLPRVPMRPAGMQPGMLGARHASWSVDLVPLCRAPDPAGSCPNCFSHDQPDDPDRQPGKLPRSWWDDSGCREPRFSLPDLGTATDVPTALLQDRAALLRRLESARRGLDSAAAIQGMDEFQQQALRMIVAAHGRHNPFDLAQESDETRDLYGREVWGQGFLVARRLVEAGVRMVQVNLYGWDTHQNAFRDLKGKLLPSLDRCLSGFLDDLDRRGLLTETLVVMCGEMGRTPRISPIAVGGLNAAGVPFTPGRHHWGDVFPCLVAGAGIAHGRVVGATDRYGGVPATAAYTPADLAATIFHLLGIDPETEFTDVDGRPFRLYRGEPIAPVLA